MTQLGPEDLLRAVAEQLADPLVGVDHVAVDVDQQPLERRRRQHVEPLAHARLFLPDLGQQGPGLVAGLAGISAANACASRVYQSGGEGATAAHVNAIGIGVGRFARNGLLSRLSPGVCDRLDG